MQTGEGGGVATEAKWRYETGLSVVQGAGYVGKCKR